VRRNGAVVDARHAFARAVFVPISVAIAIVGLIGLVVGKERRALFDVVGGTVTVYDWGSRDAEQPVTIREHLSARVGRRHSVAS
jgi:xanthosine utilization system XapX-like protein